MKQFLVVLLLSVFFQNFAQGNKEYNLENKLAIQGYDPVAYFSNKVVKGDKIAAATYEGTIYYFSTKENKKLFESNPSKYEPQYGGWCAYAMGNIGKKVTIDPTTFKIVDGKLYLFYNAYFNNTLKSWNKDEKKLKAKADINWSNIIKQK
jgi:YHS domain-containing protein